jgi:enoyl-CoA hydratase/carnithine racemase
MDSSEILHRVEHGAAFLTINREAARNALSATAVQALIDAVEKARAVVLTGAGDKMFCSGGDLSSMTGDGFLAGHEGRRGYGQLLLALQSCKKPTVARVNGHALAGGLGLVLACDLAVASDAAGFGTPEIDRGLFPMMVIALLQRHVGKKRALELVLTGRRLTAAEASSWGLVNQVVPAAQLDAATLELVKGLAGKSQAVLGLGKRAYFAAEGLPVDRAIELLAANLSINVTLEDAAEGVMAFMQKRA